MDAAVGAQGKCGTNLFLTGLFTHGNSDHLCRDSSFLQSYRLFHGDLTERVDGHFDVVQVNVTAIALGTDFDVIVNDAFNGNKNLHRISNASFGWV